MGAYFKGLQVTFPFEVNTRVRVADARDLPLPRRTVRVQVTVMVPWATVVTDLLLAILFR